MPKFVQFGCGMVAPRSWINYDGSPTVRLKNVPLLGQLLKPWLYADFPRNVRFGDIIKGLPETDGSCDGMYSCHVLEHLSFEDGKKALANTYKLLKVGGVFRIVVPDLAFEARQYIQKLEAGDAGAGNFFMHDSLMGRPNRPKTLKHILSDIWGSWYHLWMWDSASLTQALRQAGFSQVRLCAMGDAANPVFAEVEQAKMWVNVVALEAIK